MSPTRHLLMLGDTPSRGAGLHLTGFGRVMRRLYDAWAPHFTRIDVWGIGYTGQRHDLPGTHIFPASGDAGGVWIPWDHYKRLSLFLRELDLGGYTHVFLLQDTFKLSAHGFPAEFADVCRRRGIVSMLYYPVDAPLDKWWCDIVRAVDLPVCYTEYGKAETVKHCPELADRIQVIPHGCETDVFKPLLETPPRPCAIEVGPAGKRAPLLKLADGEFLLLNVGAHQHRKDTVRSLLVLRHLLDLGVKAKLLFHFSNLRTGTETSPNGISLRSAAEQLGLVAGRDWNFTRAAEPQHHWSDADLNLLYNLADVTLTCTRGEGWGLTITEALAAGCPVAGMPHTSVGEIFDRCWADKTGHCVRLPALPGGVMYELDMSRWRPVLNAAAAAEVLREFLLARKPRRPMKDATKRWLDWARIGGAFRQLWDSPPPIQADRGYGSAPVVARPARARLENSSPVPGRSGQPTRELAGSANPNSSDYRWFPERSQKPEVRSWKPLNPQPSTA
jgi:glycosyltransferase involved in cell wall biosynthesis